MTLELRQLLFDFDKPIEHVYFPEDAIGSVVSPLADGSAVETAIVGHEGMIGLPVFLGTERMSAQAFIQSAGRGWRMSAAALREAVAEGGELGPRLLRYIQTVLTQVGQSSACNRMHSVEVRCARWLLMTQDRVGRDEFSLTHQFLAQMLGVRRATVTVTAGALQKAGFIEYSRGIISILDRKGLENAACECYNIIRHELDRVLGDRPAGMNPLAGMKTAQDDHSILDAPGPRQNIDVPSSY
jgi:CRP-like cAMP-binding protein